MTQKKKKKRKPRKSVFPFATVEEKLAVKEFGADDLHQLRMGYIDLGRPCDSYVSRAKEMIPGKVLPTAWSYTNPKKFVKVYGIGHHWAITASSHTLLIRGQRVLRIWTRTNSPYVHIGVAEELVEVLSKKLLVEETSPLSWPMWKPFKYSCTAKSTLYIDYLMLCVGLVYKVGVNR